MARQQQQGATTANQMTSNRQAAADQLQNELRRCAEYARTEQTKAEKLVDALLRDVMRDTQQVLSKDAAQLQAKLEHLGAAQNQMNKEWADVQTLYTSVSSQMENIVAAGQADNNKVLAAVKAKYVDMSCCWGELYNILAQHPHSIETVSKRAVAAADDMVERFG